MTAAPQLQDPSQVALGARCWGRACRLSFRFLVIHQGHLESCQGNVSHELLPYFSWLWSFPSRLMGEARPCWCKCLRTKPLESLPSLAGHMRELHVLSLCDGFVLLPMEICFSLSSVQSLSCVWLFATPWTAAHQASLSFLISRSLFKPTSIVSVMPSNHLILCHPLLLLPSIFPSIRVFFNESVLHIKWPKYWNFSFSISPSNEYSGLISFRMDWLDLLAVQGILKSLLQHHSSKASLSSAKHNCVLVGKSSFPLPPVR